MKILIVYGSKMEGTAGIASMLGNALLSCGVHADVLRAEDAVPPRGYDAVIVGSGLYAARWRHPARQFVARNTKALLEVPTWFFSSGPLDDSARTQDIPPTRQVARLMSRAGARGHITFGGRLLPDARGFPASSMARTHAGDWRDPEQIKAWVRRIVEELRLESLPPVRGQAVAPAVEQGVGV
jgi:menaquinone-dependent protoporphyrinogen oxidase